MKTNRTYSAKPSEINRKWFVVDASKLPLGRTATRVATLLCGKHKPGYTPHMDTGDFVIVTNAAKVKFTGNKLEQKMYYKHSGFIGGIKSINAKDLLQKKPEDVITHAIRGMLPKGPLGRQMLKKLKVYAQETHPHAAQGPQALEF